MVRAVIYGATTTGKRVYQEVKDKYDILYFVDGNPLLIGKKADALEVNAPKKILEDKPDIIIMGILTDRKSVV